MKTTDDLKAVLYKTGKKTPLVERFLSLPGIDKIPYREEDEIPAVTGSLSGDYSSKEVIVLRENRGRVFQMCPGTPNMICCNYRVLNTCFGCLYDCAYCFLLYYLNTFGIVQFINLENLGRVIAENTEPGRVYRIGTGEFTDSLMMDQVTGIAESLIRDVRDTGTFCEFKTKSDNVDHLLELDHGPGIVFAWSLNTEYNIHNYEKDTAGLDRRISAAARAADAGYLLAFHFDPILYYDRCQEDYHAVVDSLFREVDPSRVAWISLGGFRYSPDFKDIMRKAFPDEALTAGELFPGPDGKYRYLKQKRVALYRNLKEWIYSYNSDIFVYLCMETGDVWESVFGRHYRESGELEHDLARHLSLRFSWSD